MAMTAKTWLSNMQYCCYRGTAVRDIVRQFHTRISVIEDNRYAVIQIWKAYDGES